MKTNDIKAKPTKIEKKVFEKATETMKRSMRSSVTGPEKDRYTRFDGPVNRITVNGEEMIYIW